MTLQREMIGSTAAQASAAWSWPSSSPTPQQQEDADGPSPLPYNSRPFHRCPPTSPPMVSADVAHAHPIAFDFYPFPPPFDSPPGIDMDTATLHHDEHTPRWMSHYPPQQYQPFMATHGLPMQHGLSSHLSNHGFAIPWDVPPMPPVDMPPMHPEQQDGFASDRGGGEPRGSVSSVAFSTPQTTASSMSDGWVFPVSSPPHGSPGASGHREVVDLHQPGDDHVNHAATFEQNFMPFKAGSPISSDDLSIDEGAHIDWALVDTFGAETVHWSPPQPMPHPHVQPLETFDQIPWPQQHEPQRDFVDHMQANCVPFPQPTPQSPFQEYRSQDDATPMKKANTMTNESRSARKTKDVEWEEVQMAAYAASYSSHSRSPPVSQRTPSQTSSPSQSSPSPRRARAHSHLVNAFPGPQKRNGRVRPLTNKEKRNAREVRLAGACWSCHLSKIRCSPCSPGAPCEQCARLSGKRRYCLLPCFNDPLEALNTFLVPDYLMGHFTRANVENFINSNATGWGSEALVVQLTWGFQRPLKATVVTLTTTSPGSELNHRHRAIANGTAAPTLSRHESPPLGVKLEEMLDMQAEYAAYVKDIVMNDLDYYADEAYSDEESELPELLLKAVCDFYTAGLEADEECDLLRQAIEIHVTCTILERSLILDNQSLQVVEQSLGQKFPAQSVPRCAQRQIKLALFNQQRQRIFSVLAKWGSLMWATNSGTTNERKWAVGFSVFLVLTLIIDKTLGAAYLFCESRINNQGFDAEEERAKFEQLGRLTETVLFERCKEILHSRFKTRKAGQQSCNPIRDGGGAWKGKPVDARTDRFVRDMQTVVVEFSEEIRSHRSAMPEDPSEDCHFMDAGRLACILLDDFLDH